MTDYGYVFAMNLHGKLKQAVFGKVFCTTTSDNQLYVKIENRADLKFELYIDDISEKIVNGYSTDYAVYEIMQKYRRFIMNKFIVS